MSKRYSEIIGAGALALLLGGCGDDATESAAALQSAAPTPVTAPVQRHLDFASVARGAVLFRANCASCHGGEAEGHPNWRRPGADGRYPPPPLNGSGHAWHHPSAMLRQVVKYGSPGGRGNMPAWQDRLGDVQIGDIIAWMQSRWPDPLYAAWLRTERNAQAARSRSKATVKE